MKEKRNQTLIISIIGLSLVLVILALTIPVTIWINCCVELEKYKIQMQVYGEETNQNMVERKD